MSDLSLSMSFNAFLGLTQDQRQGMFEEHGRIHDADIKRTLSENAWAVFRGDSAEPVIKDPDMMKFPTTEDLMALGARLDVPIFVRARPAIIEEVSCRAA